MIRLNYAEKSLLVIVSFFALVPGFFCRKFLPLLALMQLALIIIPEGLLFSAS